MAETAISNQKRIGRKGRGLQWKLTFLYAVVTVAAVITLVFVLLVLSVLLSAPRPSPDGLLGLLDQAALEVAPYLDTTSADNNGLVQWLQTDFHPFNGFTIAVQGKSASDMRSQANPSKLSGSLIANRGMLVILDAGGKPVALVSTSTSIPPIEFAALASRFQSGLTPGEKHIIDTARSNQGNTAHFTTSTPDGGMSAAAPVRSDSGQIVGVIFIRTPGSQSLSTAIRDALGYGLPLLIVITVIAIAVGTLFGFLAARWLTRRFKVLSTAADAWSTGNFSVSVPARGNDELDQLAIHFNGMVTQLKTLLETRQRLAALEERQSLARDLHDSVKQEVFATAMQLGAVRELLDREPARAREHLVEAERLAHQAQLELQGIILELRPEEGDLDEANLGLIEASEVRDRLAQEGLEAVLKDYVTDWARSHGIEAELSVQNGNHIPLPVQRALFRVAQEALANTARHSGAKKCELRLAKDSEMAVLDVIDDGRGFDSAEISGPGFGLRSMRERIEALGGTLQIESGREGTKVMASVPLIEDASVPLEGRKV